VKRTLEQTEYGGSQFRHVTDGAAVCDFDARRYRLAYSGADFVVMPLHLDPCALPCKIGQCYGELPIVRWFKWFAEGKQMAIEECVTPCC